MKQADAVQGLILPSGATTWQQLRRDERLEHRAALLLSTKHIILLSGRHR